jgi:ankyrin repeat protein
MQTNSLEDQIVIAVQTDDADTLRQLLSESSSERVRWKWFQKADPLLVIAATEGAINSAALLLENRATAVDEPGLNGFTPLEIAARFGNREMCQLLLRYGASPTRHQGNPSALQTAAFRGDLELVDLFLKYNADPNDICQSNNVSLFRIRGDILRRLIAAGGVLPEPIHEIINNRQALGDSTNRKQKGFPSM